MAVKFEKVSDGNYMLDVLGYVCPHPQLYTKKAMEKLKQGDTLELVFDNPSSGNRSSPCARRTAMRLSNRYIKSARRCICASAKPRSQTGERMHENKFVGCHRSGGVLSRIPDWLFHLSAE
jgi:TusA-related sulfurtransferase